MNNEYVLKNKSGEWFFKKKEDEFKNFILPKIPLWLETYHLTSLTFIWSALVVCCFYFGLSSEFFLWFIPLLVFFQYITDLLDGSIGRLRDTGLVRWGYYADHFLDFIFMTAIVIGYGLVLGFGFWIFMIYAVLCGFLVHTFLLVTANNAFNISYLGIGPTEGRLLFIIFHLIFVFNGVSFINTVLPYIAVFSLFLLICAFLGSQKKLWKIDMDNKKAPK
ncbi:MAG: CDP-alcohol phosphatidyltransferase family protein [bacterium]